MEKTKGLSLSAEEKKELQRQEWLGKARGWIQKYLDGTVEVEDLKSELGKLGEPEGAEGVLKEEILAAVDPEGDNQKRWEVLEALWQIPRAPYIEILEGFQASVAKTGREQAGRLLDRLAHNKISGTAVIPNLNRDPDWVSFHRQAVADCRDKLKFSLKTST